MNRRDTLTTLLALGTAGGPLGVLGQVTPTVQGKTIGVLAQQSMADAERFWLGGFRARLQALGWIERQNLTLANAFADYHAERIPVLAEGLVHKRVDVIWAFGADAALAAARASRAIPIVFVGVPWPVETGLVDSFARPGRNVTGISSYTGVEVSTKRLEFLKEVAPAATRLSWMLDAGMEATLDGGRFEVRPLLEAAARRLGYDVRFHTVQRAEAIEPAFAEILQLRAHAIAVAGGATIFTARDRISAFALRNRLPSACASGSLVDAGCLLSYGSSGVFAQTIERGAEHVDRILRGARPADLPVHRPDRYELAVNLKTARALGLQIPQSLILRTDRVIE